MINVNRRHTHFVHSAGQRSFVTDILETKRKIRGNEREPLIVVSDNGSNLTSGIQREFDARLSRGAKHSHASRRLKKRANSGRPRRDTAHAT